METQLVHFLSPLFVFSTDVVSESTCIIYYLLN